MKKNFIARTVLGLACFSLMPSLVSLPVSSEVVSGSVSISTPNENTMYIEAGDQSIINYRSFSVADGESVRFIQPSSSSSVLNRIVGEDPSKILGSLESNGRVFLVNPNGVYFGPGAEVNMGSLIVSTLDISNDDFSNGNYVFNLSEGAEGSKIVNLGSLAANSGSVVFMASHIQSEGKIVASAGSVVAAAGKKVTLDFVGNGLVSFAVEGELEEAMIEQLGSIEAMKGTVHLAMSSVNKTLQSVINTDGIEIGNALVEENGVIRLVDSSSISSQDIVISASSGSTVKVSGKLDVSSLDSKGGSLKVFGEQILVGATVMNASGALGGGEVLIGGDYKGEGSSFNAGRVTIGEKAVIVADSTSLGDGGKVIVWSDGRTRFNGSISAKGAGAGGNGGFVETSGKVALGVKGRVDTSAELGEAGTWLLDPATILISSTGVNSLEGADDKFDLTSNLSISPSVFSEVTSNVVLSAMARGGSITVDSETTIQMASGYGIQFDVESSSGQIILKNNSSIQTDGSKVTFNGPVVLDGDLVSVLTNLDGRSGDVSFNYAVNGSSGLSALTINAGESGKVNLLSSAGSSAPIGALDVTARTLYVASDITTKGQAIDVTGRMVLTGDSILDTTVGGAYAGADVNFHGKSSSINGPFKLFLETGSGDVNLEGPIGSLYPLESFKVSGARTVLSSNLTTDGNTMVFLSPVILTADVTLTDNGTSGIFFLDTVNGDGSGPWQLTANAPIGEVSFIGQVGNTQPLSGLIVSANTVSQSSSVRLRNTPGAAVTLTYSGPAGIQVGGDISTSIGDSIITMNNPVLFVVNPGNGLTPANDGAVTVSAGAGTAAPVVVFNGVAAGSGNLVVVTGGTGFSGSVALQNSVVDLVSLSITADSISQDANSAIFAAGDITLDASGGGSAMSLTTAASISTTDGTVLLKGGALVATVASNISAGTGDITLEPTIIPISYQGNMKTSGGAVVSNAPGLILTGDTIINVDDGSVTLNAVDGNVAFTVSGSDMASLNLGGAVGGTALASFEAGIGSILQTNTVSVAGPLTYVAPLGITVTGASIATTTVAGTVTIIGPVSLGADFVISAAGAGADILFEGSTSTIVSPSVARTLTISPQATGIVTFGGAIGTGNPLARLNVTAGAQVNVASNITVSGPLGIVFSPDVVLTGPSTMTALNGAVTFSADLDGTQPLNINAGTGVVTFDGVVGGVNYLAGLNVVGSEIDVNTTAVNVVGGETIFNAPVVLGASTVFTNNGQGITFLSTVDGPSFDLTADSSTGIVHFGGAIGAGAGGGNIDNVTASALAIESLGEITPAAGGSVTFTAPNSILVAADITTQGNGAITMNNSLTLGTTVTLTSGVGAVVLNGVQAGSAALVVSTGTTGGVTLSGAPYSLSALSVTSLGNIVQALVSPIATIGNLSLDGVNVTTNASLSSSGGGISLTGSTAVTINSNIAAGGGDVVFTGDTQYNGGTISTGNGDLHVLDGFTLGGDTSINVGSGSVLFDGIVTGANGLSISGTPIGGLVFGGVVGGTALTALVAEIGNITQSNSVSTVGPVTYSAVSGINLGGNITTTSTLLGTVTILGPTTLTAGVTITTDSAGILFEGSGSSINGAQALSLSAGTGNVRLDGPLGFNKALASLSVTSSGTTLIGSDINTAGNQTYGAGGAGTGNIVLTGDSSMNSGNNAIVFNGTINGNQNLLVNAGASTVAYVGVVGGVTPLKSLDTIASSGISLSSDMSAR